ncbi:hypothetical protein KSP35_06685 [Aquihabitans sp. G128]|uniref:hypothetical protein n=1 Tax=Aquihabitans sp. G128 TaxID=2849779 RepID=UPI001C2389F0|nr:hypothetical protein [Aquihabitans sp. G128]QXC62482.1 hypothetical protein KSP35_06685 [Aquihabitans sp. G128]
MDTTPTSHPDHNHTARGAGVVGLAAIALVHLLDLQGKLTETPYLGYAYIALIVGCVVAAAMLVRGDVRRGWLLGGGLAAATLVGYVVNRTVGMPSATEDIGNWLEPLGLASIFIEGCVAALAAGELVALRSHGATTASSRGDAERRPARV